MSKAKAAGKYVALKHVDTFQDRHGKWRWYFRTEFDGRLALPDPGDPARPSPEFCQRYKSYFDMFCFDDETGAFNSTARVYFLVVKKRVKIGFSRNPAKRLAMLQTGHAQKLRFRYLTPGTDATEREIHKRFAHLRIMGEWFHFTEEVREWIANDKEERKQKRLERNNSIPNLKIKTDANLLKE